MYSHTANGARKPSMRCTRIDIIHDPKMLDHAKALKKRMVNDTVEARCDSKLYILSHGYWPYSLDPCIQFWYLDSIGL